MNRTWLRISTNLDINIDIVYLPMKNVGVVAHKQFLNIEYSKGSYGIKPLTCAKNNFYLFGVFFQQCFIMHDQQL